MNIQQQYTTIIQPSPFSIRQYRTPSQYLDPNKIIQDRKKQSNKRFPQGKFKPSKRQRQFFIDQLISSIKLNPGPANYNTSRDILSSAKSTNSKHSNNNPNATNKKKVTPVKDTYIDQIQRNQKKHKAPGVGKYNLLKLTDFTPISKHSKSISNLNPQKKRNWLQGKLIQTLTHPGPGNHNPHYPQKVVKPDITDSNFYRQKHKEDEVKIKRSLSAKLGPTTYTPVHSNTFDCFKIKAKQPQVSNWSKCNVEIRKGLRSAQKCPGPAEYQLINQWSSGKGPLSRSKSINCIGKIRLFQRTIKTARSQSIYRD